MKFLMNARGFIETPDGSPLAQTPSCPGEAASSARMGLIDEEVCAASFQGSIRRFA